MAQTLREGLSWVDVDYAPKPNKVNTYLTDVYPTEDVNLIGGAWVFAFNVEGALLLTRLRIRGVDIPGGKVDPEERTKYKSVAELGQAVALRETYEESKVKVKNMKLLGYRTFVSSCPPPPVQKFPFPVCHFLYYYADVEQEDEFVEEPQPNGSVARLFLKEELAVAEPMVLLYIIFPCLFI